MRPRFFIVKIWKLSLDNLGGTYQFTIFKQTEEVAAGAHALQRNHIGVLHALRSDFLAIDIINFHIGSLDVIHGDNSGGRVRINSNLHFAIILNTSHACHISGETGNNVVSVWQT